jgi:uncharacterized protein DUF2169
MPTVFTTRTVACELARWHEHGRLRGALVCRVGFVLAPDTATVEAGHAPPPAGPPGRPRGRSDVVVVGPAHPLPGQWHARLVVGALDKTVPVHESPHGHTAPALGPLPLAERPEIAPPDQRIEPPLRADARIVLDGLHPTWPRLECRLPGVEPQAVVQRGGEVQRVPLAAELLWIDSARGACVVEWRGLLPDDAEVVHVAEGSHDAPRAIDAIQAAADVAVDATEAPYPDAVFDTIATTRARVAPLPFAGTRSTPPPPLDMPPAQSTGTLIGDRALVPPGAAAAPVPHVWTEAPRAPGWCDRIAAHARPWQPVVPASDRADLERAAARGAAAASAEAARRTEAAPEPRRARSVTPSAPRVALDLLWFDVAAVGRILRAELLSSADLPPPSCERPGASDVDGEQGAVAALLAAAPRSELDALPVIFARKNAEEAGARPVVCVEAELRVCLRPRERLRRMAELAEIFVHGDKRLRDLLDRIRPCVELANAPDDVADASCHQLVEAFQAPARGLAEGYLEANADRALVEERKLFEQTLLGGPHLRAVVGGGEHAVVAYLPQAVAEVLPIATRFRARIAAELRPRQDERDAAPIALRVLALAAVLDLGARRLEPRAHVAPR